MSSGSELQPRKAFGVEAVDARADTVGEFSAGRHTGEPPARVTRRTSSRFYVQTAEDPPLPLALSHHPQNTDRRCSRGCNGQGCLVWATRSRYQTFFFLFNGAQTIARVRKPARLESIFITIIISRSRYTLLSSQVFSLKRCLIVAFFVRRGRAQRGLTHGLGK